MKRFLKLLPVIIVILTLTEYSCAQSFHVIKVDPALEEVNNEGIFYNLGKSKLIVDVQVTKIERIKGPYAEFAGKYLGLTNVITQNATSFELNSMSVRTTVVPDPEQYYFVVPSGKGGKDASGLLLEFSESGILMGTGGQPAACEMPESYSPSAEEENVYPDVFKYFSDLNLFEQVDTIIERINMDTATIEKMVLKRTLVEKSPEQKARDAADFIMKVKESRLNLISGYQEVNYDKETFTLMNQELEKLEAEYQKLFTGLTFTKTLEYRFSFVPKEEKPSDTIALFRFSELRGVLDTSNANGKLVVMCINSTGHTAAVKDFIKKKPQEKVKYRGFFYRMPEFADVNIFSGDRLRHSGSLLISQFGPVHYLPARKAALGMFPGTSSIHKVSFGE
jgi:hypothetical protein